MPHDRSTAKRKKKQTDAKSRSLTDPVTSIRVLPDGEMYIFNEFRLTTEPKKAKPRLTIGRSPKCDIVIDDSSMAPAHCYLERHRGRVFLVHVNEKNRISINGVRLHGGTAELISGNLITMGKTTLLACGRAGIDQQADILARDPGEYMQTSTTVYGSGRRAAEIFRIPQTTFAHWLRGRFAKARKKSR